MSAFPRKRPRSAEVPVESASLASRLSQIPRTWHFAATKAGTSDIDGFICHLGRTVSEAINTLQSSAEAARARLRETRWAIHAAVDARFDDLELQVNTAVAVKSAALERELVDVDYVLERWRVDSAALGHSIAAIADTEFETQHALLSSRLDDVKSQLNALPTAVIEPPVVDVRVDSTALLGVVAGFGRVLAPLPVTADDLSFEETSNDTRVRSGDTLHLCMSLGVRHATQSPEELSMSLRKLAEETSVDAALEASDVEPQAVAASVASDAALRTLLISLIVPASAPAGSCIVIRGVFAGGRPVAKLPLMLTVCRGLQTPLCLTGLGKYSFGPCISPDGLLYVPPGGSGNDVNVFDAQGTMLPGISLDGLGLDNAIKWAAYVHGDNPCLLLADDHRVVALDPSTRVVRWATNLVGLVCGGLAPLPSPGVVAINSATNDTLLLYRLSDGIRCGIHQVSGRFGSFLAADSATGLVFGCCGQGMAGFCVEAWLCAADGLSLISRGSVNAAAMMSTAILAVVPPTCGKRGSHLIVGSLLTSELLVLSLPDFALVHTHRLEGMRVQGLAADPLGYALAVCDRVSMSLHVLAWPLPGMPLLA